MEIKIFLFKIRPFAELLNYEKISSISQRFSQSCFTLLLRKFFQVGIGALAFLLWEPQVEGVNAHSTNFEIYFKDPFLAYAYIASIPFFVALYQAFKLLRNIGENKVHSQSSLRALRLIKYCGFILVGSIAVGEVFLLFGPSDDRPPIIMMGLIATLMCVTTAAAAALFEKLLYAATEMKVENDLTV